MSENFLQYSESQLIKLSTLWRREEKDGQIFYTGKLGSCGRLLLTASERDGELILYIVREKEGKYKKEE